MAGKLKPLDIQREEKPGKYADGDGLYGRVKAGKTGGSRRKFMNAATNHLIVFHEPHNGEMKQSLVRDVREQLESKGLL
jgi:hypothetical protein